MDVAQPPTAQFPPPSSALSDASSGTLGREQLLARIVHLNPTATTAFLSGFSSDELHRYFDHLSQTERGHVRGRPADARGVVTRESWL